MDSLQMNDWPIKKFNIVSVSILVSFIGLIFLDQIGINVPVVRTILGLIILILIPGYSILRILRIHDIDGIKSALLAVGISLSFLMIFGAILSIFCPLIGIQHPLSPNILSLSVIVVLILLLIIANYFDRDFTFLEGKSRFISLINPYVLFSIFSLFLGLIGVFLATFWNNNLVLMVFILLISVLPLIIYFKKIPSKLFPIIIFFISLALLYHVSLFSQYVVGTDVFTEVFMASQTFMNGVWNPSFSLLAQNYNSSLSVSLLPSIFTLITGIPILWYFKAIAPIFFALVPVGLLYLYVNAFKNTLSQKEALMAVFLFIFIWYFYNMMIGVVRQQLAEFFYVLLLIIIFDNIQSKRMSYSIIFILLSLSVIFSHYSVANLFLFFAILYSAASYLFFRGKPVSKFNITFNYVLLFFVVVFCWNMYIGNGSVFKTMVLMGQGVLNTLSEFFLPETNVSVRIATTSSINLAHVIFRYLYYLIVALIAIGGLALLKNLVGAFKGKLGSFSFPNRYKNDHKFMRFEVFAFTNYALLALYLFIPLIGFQLGFDRVFHIALILLAPYFIIGFKAVLNILTYLKGICNLRINLKVSSSALIAIFLTVLFLFNSGFIFELSNDPLPNSVPLSLKNFNDPNQIENSAGSLYLKIYTVEPSEYDAGLWLRDHLDSRRVYTTFGNKLAINGIMTPYLNVIQLENISDVRNIQSGYLYINFLNNIMNLQISRPTKYSQEIVDNISADDKLYIDNKMNKIYATTGDSVYYNN